MRFLKIVISAVFLTSLSVSVASAQESHGSDKYHPMLSTTFNIGLGVYAPTQKNRIGATADFLDENFQESLDSTESQITGMLDFRWRFNDDWSFQANYWVTGSDSNDTLTEDFPIGDDGVVLEKGSFVGSGLDISVARLFLGRSFNRTPSTDWGVGFGLHWMELDAYVEGQGQIRGEDGEAVIGTDGPQRASGSFGAPMPNLGIWYMHSWSPKWVFTTRLDWFDITFEDISGRIIDASIGVNYQMSDHFGVGLAYNAFDLDVDIDEDRWLSSDLGTRQYGPRLNLTYNW